MAKNVPEISHIVSDCKALATFYNVSAVRMKGLRNTAVDSGVEVYQFPHLKDIRFTEYTYGLLHSILRNYRPMIEHLERETGDVDMQNFLLKWKDEDTVRMTAILCDVLFVYQRFQKYIQSDLISVFDLESARDFYGAELLKLVNNSLTAGFEEKILRPE